MGRQRRTCLTRGFTGRWADSMKRRTRWIAATVAALLSIPLVLVTSFAYLSSMVEEAYRTGVRVSTDADSVIIPAIGVTLAWTGLLFAIGVATGLVLLVRWWLRPRPPDPPLQRT